MLYIQWLLLTRGRPNFVASVPIDAFDYLWRQDTIVVKRGVIIKGLGWLGGLEPHPHPNHFIYKCSCCKLWQGCANDGGLKLVLFMWPRSAIVSGCLCFVSEGCLPQQTGMLLCERLSRSLFISWNTILPLCVRGASGPRSSFISHKWNRGHMCCRQHESLPRFATWSSTCEVLSWAQSRKIEGGDQASLLCIQNTSNLPSMSKMDSQPPWPFGNPSRCACATSHHFRGPTRGSISSWERGQWVSSNENIAKVNRRML